MIAKKKNQMDSAILDTSLPECIADLSFCGGAYPKFGEQLKGGALEEDFSNLNNKIVYKNSIVQSAMFF